MPNAVSVHGCTALMIAGVNVATTELPPTYEMESEHVMPKSSVTSSLIKPVD